MFKKLKFSTKIFVAAALANFILLGFLLLFLKTNFNIINDLGEAYREDSSAGTYYLNEDYSSGDPLITKVPSLKDILAGPIISDFDPSLGPNNAPVVIVYFADFVCDYCHQQKAVLKQIVEQYEGRVRLIWKDYPRAGIDSLSWQTAIAARCAGEQGVFWQYHDLLYEKLVGDITDEEVFISLAEKLGLKKDLFIACRQDEKIIRLIKDNILEARALNINGVPFIYINKQGVAGQATATDLKRAIEIELKNSP